MKDKQGKHDHKLTKLLKFGLFATLMVAPLFAVLFKCMYVTFNKNAYQSYSQTIENQDLSLDNQELPLYDVTFNLSNDKQFTTSDTVIYVTNVKYNYGSLTTSQIESLEDTTYIRLWYNSGYANNYMNWLNSNGNVSAGSNSLNITFTLTNIQANQSYDLTTFDGWFYRGTSNNTLDNAFYYSVDEMQNNTLFNWTTSTAIYTPIDAMTSGLGITTDAVAILLTYWLYLTLIYIVIDIVVELFTWMTHTLLGKPLS